MSRFDDVDLSQLPPPDLIEALDYEAYLAEWKADFVARAAEAGIDYDVGMLETDPMMVAMQVGAYREQRLRALVNDKARAVLLALSRGRDLDALAALYKIARQVVTPAAGLAPAVLESDERLRAIVHNAPEALSTCGPPGAYRHHAMRADVSVKDVGIYKIEGTGEVHVLPLVDTGDGTPSAEVLVKVRAAIATDLRLPLTDIARVRAPLVRPYAVGVHLLVKRGPDPAVIRDAARARLATYVAERHKVGETVYRSGATAAAQVGGVDNVVLDLSGDLVPGRDEAFYCTAVTVTSEVLA